MTTATTESVAPATGPGQSTLPAAGTGEPTTPATNPGTSASTAPATDSGSGASTASATGAGDAAEPATSSGSGSGVGVPLAGAGREAAGAPATGSGAGTAPATAAEADAADAAVAAAEADAATTAAGAGGGAGAGGAAAVGDGKAAPVAPGCLEDLVGDVDAFFSEHWAGQPVVLRAHSDLSGLICEEEMWEEVECGLLSRPYFTVFNEGVRTAISDMTRRRRVVGHELPGFIEPVQIREDFAQGATFKFNQAEHWHPRIRALVKAMEPHFAGGLEAFVFLSPPGKTAMQAHTDGAHVFILQVAGVKDWVVGRIDASSTSDSSLHEGPIADHARMEVTLRPGDVLYMPHGTPHYATAREGNSIHVAVTIEEPTAENLAEVVLAGFLGSAPVTALHERHHQYRLGERTELLRRALAEYLRGVDEDAVTAAAVTLRRQHR
ncbi:JmjC domain-containing protein [Streptomyces sp. NPDC086783]|uniref:JmjC domain-containing protein n=1 Tax=Streptomyces sp. NPDC086783 TaxID=3365758 RepID=UPI003820BF2A